MNIEELKRLAEAATPGPWAHGVTWIEHLGGIVVLGNTARSKQDVAYVSAANPAAILELIRQRDELLAALKVFADKYNSAPDGDLGIGLVNGDFFRAIDAITKSEAP